MCLVVLRCDFNPGITGYYVELRMPFSPPCTNNFHLTSTTWGVNTISNKQICNTVVFSAESNND